LFDLGYVISRDFRTNNAAASLRAKNEGPEGRIAFLFYSVRAPMRLFGRIALARRIVAKLNNARLLVTGKNASCNRRNMISLAD
jgi:hypothetical protein